MYEFILPDLGEGVHEAEILKWHVQAGGTIKEDDPLVEVETDKATVTIPTPKGGTVVSLGGEVGSTISVGSVVAVIDEGGEAAVAMPAPAAVEEGLGAPVSILVNNAGIPDAQRAHKMSLELIDSVFDTNLRGPYILSCEVARRLIEVKPSGLHGRAHVGLCTRTRAVPSGSSTTS